jgi:hypothetical protein
VALQWARNTFVVLATDDSEPLHVSWVRMWIGSPWVGLDGRERQFRFRQQ